MVFLDTNVLVYAAVPGSLYHDAALLALREPGPWRLSRQVLREFLSVMSRAQTHGQAQPMVVLIAALRSFESRFTVLEDGPDVTSKLLELLGHVPTAGKQVHDANLVATMLAHGVRRLLTANVSDFQRFGDQIDIAPLA